MLVGDVDAFGPALEAAGLGTIVIDRDDAGPSVAPLADEDATAGPIDEDADRGPTAGAEDPDLPGTADEPVPTEAVGEPEA